MTDAVAGAPVVTKRARPRFLQWPLIRMVIALCFLMVPFVILQIILQKLPIDKALMQVWPALLSVACCYFMYRVYVRTIEQRPVTELAGS